MGLGSTKAHDQVHWRLFYGHQGIMHICPLIIEKQHASCGLMTTALPALELRFRCQLRITRPSLWALLCPCARMVVHVYVGLTNGLPMACTSSSGRPRLAWHQLITHIMDLCADWPYTVPRRRSGCASSTAICVRPVVSDVKVGHSACANVTVPSLGCELLGLMP